MFDQNKPTLILVRGVSGAGKSTFAKLLAGLEDFKEVSADDFMNDNYGNYHFKPSLLRGCHTVCQGYAETQLRIGKSIIVHNTSTTEAEVKTYQDIAEKHGANFFSVIVENRNDTKNVHGVDEATLQRQASRFSVKLR